MLAVTLILCWVYLFKPRYLLGVYLTHKVLTHLQNTVCWAAGLSSVVSPPHLSLCALPCVSISLSGSFQHLSRQKGTLSQECDANVFFQAPVTLMRDSLSVLLSKGCESTLCFPITTLLMQVPKQSGVRFAGPVEPHFHKPGRVT